MNNPITLTAEAAAEVLGLAMSTLAKLRLSGNGPVYCKLGRRVVYRKEDLEAWLDSRVARNTSDAGRLLRPGWRPQCPERAPWCECRENNPPYVFDLNEASSYFESVPKQPRKFPS